MLDLKKLREALPEKPKGCCIHDISYEKICQSCSLNCDADVYLGIIYELLAMLNA